ncbi:MAG: DUF1003 domain-containing protein [Phycisphaerae bacterium]|nr:DUF1003 domain-containing protein [Saprospiraceae bacterium]
MLKKSARYLHELMETESAQLAKLHKIVQDSFDEEALISQRVSEENEKRRPTFGERVADRVAEFGGSWPFIIIFSSMLLGWIAINTFVLINHPFDPYPYILLNLVLSSVAALQAPVIMMSQNRQGVKDRENAANDYVINLKSEIEVRHLHEKIDLMMEEQYHHLFEVQQQQLKMLEELQTELRKLKPESGKK